MSVKQDGSDWILLGNTRRGGVLVAHTRPREPFPYKAVKLFARGERDPRIGLDPIDVNEGPSRSAPELPDEKALADELRIVRHAAAATTPADRRDELAMAIRTLAYRLGLHNPAARVNADRQTADQVDWAAIAENDRKISPILRRIASRRPTTQPDARERQ